MAKVLLVDTNYSSIPIYKSLIKNNHEVYVTGNKDTEALAKICKNYIKIDYTDINQIKKIINSKNIEKIVPGCTDASYSSCAKIGEEYIHLWHGDSYENFLTLNNKYKFREFAEAINIPTPKFYTDIESAKKSGKKLIIKPVDSFSGKGISTAYSNNEKAFSEAISYARSESPSRKIIIEDFVSGQLYSYSAFLRNHQIQSSFLVQEDCTTDPYAVDLSFVIHNKKSDIREKLSIYIEKLSRHLKLTDGLIHTQFICNKEEIWLIEITRRCPGDQYSKLIEYSTGFRYAEKYQRFFTGSNIDEATIYQRKEIIRHTISTKKEGFFLNVKFNKKLNLMNYTSLKNFGDPVSKNDGKRIGLIFINAKKQRKKMYKNFLEKNIYNLSIEKNEK